MFMYRFRLIQIPRACRIHYTLILRFVPLAGRCITSHARGVGKDASYSLLLSKGKLYKVAVTACMRKLLTILNARMRDYFAENGTTENGIQTA